MKGLKKNLFILMIINLCGLPIYANDKSAVTTEGVHPSSCKKKVSFNEIVDIIYFQKSKRPHSPKNDKSSPLTPKFDLKAYAQLAHHYDQLTQLDQKWDSVLLIDQSLRELYEVKILMTKEQKKKKPNTDRINQLENWIKNSQEFIAKQRQHDPEIERLLFFLEDLRKTERKLNRETVQKLKNKDRLELLEMHASLASSG